jgi:ubiquitin
MGFYSTIEIQFYCINCNCSSLSIALSARGQGIGSHPPISCLKHRRTSIETSLPDKIREVTKRLCDFWLMLRVFLCRRSSDILFLKPFAFLARYSEAEACQSGAKVLSECSAAQTCSLNRRVFLCLHNPVLQGAQYIDYIDGAALARSPLYA